MRRPDERAYGDGHYTGFETGKYGEATPVDDTEPIRRQVRLLEKTRARMRRRNLWVSPEDAARHVSRASIERFGLLRSGPRGAGL